MISGTQLAINLSDPITFGLIAAAILALVLLELFIGRGIFLIRANEVGVLTKKFGGKKMAEGHIIARKGEVGVQAGTLMPGLYWKFPLYWQVHKFPITSVPVDNIGTVEAIDGEPLLPGRFTGDEVECNKFQDGEAFLENHGKKGQQVGVLTPGNYRINPMLFLVDVKPATFIDSESTGLVTAEDGIVLPPNYIIAPSPADAPSDQFPKARPTKHFQDGQAFIDSGGYRGPQKDTLQPGKYFINDLMFRVTKIPKYEVPPGFVAVIRSNVGAELQKSERIPVPLIQSRTPTDQITPGVQVAEKEETITADIESVLISDKNARGIIVEPLSPGTYNLNTVAYTAYLVPTSAIMIDWADSDHLSAPTMAGVANTAGNVTAGNLTGAVATRADRTQYPYTTEVSTKGISYFSFSQLEVISKDGFQLEVGVRMVIRIRQENAAFIIARFGTVFNLIQQIVHPLIDSSFRNDAGSKNALDFFQSRTELQQYVFNNARETFGKYHVEAQALLISFIRPADEQGQNLLNTQNLKQIAMQQQTQYQEQAKAEQQRIVVQEQTARANMQPQVVNAILQIDIEKNKAEAVRRQSEGLRDYKVNLAQGEASAIRQVGEAQADAYHAQAQVLGGEKVAMVKALEEIRTTSTKIVPDTLVMTGRDGGDASSPLITAWFARALATPSPTITPYQSKTSDNGQGPPASNQDQGSDSKGSPAMSMNLSSMATPKDSTIPGVLDINKVTPVSLQQDQPTTADNNNVNSTTRDSKRQGQ